MEFIPDYENERKKVLIEEVHARSHRGINTIFREIKNKLYNIKIEDVKVILDSCLLCAQRTVQVEMCKLHRS